MFFTWCGYRLSHSYLPNIISFGKCFPFSVQMTSLIECPSRRRDWFGLFWPYLLRSWVSLGFRTPPSPALTPISLALSFSADLVSSDFKIMEYPWAQSKVLFWCVLFSCVSHPAQAFINHVFGDNGEIIISGLTLLCARVPQPLSLPHIRVGTLGTYLGSHRQFSHIDSPDLSSFWTSPSPGMSSEATQELKPSNEKSFCVFISLTLCNGKFCWLILANYSR